MQPITHYGQSEKHQLKYECVWTVQGNPLGPGITVHANSFIWEQGTTNFHLHYSDAVQNSGPIKRQETFISPET